MSQSLLNQFRGAYLGAALGDLQCAEVSSVSGQSPPLDALNVPLGAIALGYTHTLLDASSDQMSRAIQSKPDTLPASLMPLRDVSVLMALCLPGAVFFHDNLPAFQRQLTEQRCQWCPALADWSADDVQELEDGLLLLAGVMAVIFQRQFMPKTAIASWIQQLQPLGRSPLLVAHLQCLDQQFTQCAPLAIARQHLEHCSDSTSAALGGLLPLCLALYVALSSPADLGVTLRRTQSLNRLAEFHDPESPSVMLNRLVGFLSGMIVGAYNGLEGIPLGWRHALTPGAYHPMQLSFPDGLGLRLESRWGVRTEVDILQPVDQLFALWCGASEYSRFLQSASSLAIASPPTANRIFG